MLHFNNQLLYKYVPTEGDKARQKEFLQNAPNSSDDEEVDFG